MKNLRHGIELFFLRLLFSLFSSLEDHIALHFGKGLGSLVYLLFRGRNRIARQNMELCDIGENPYERRIILRRMYQNLGMTVAEFARLKRYTAGDLKAKVKIQDVHHLDEAYALGRGVILLSGHYDNWELSVQSIAGHGYKVDLVVRQQHNLWADDFINSIRESENISVITAETQPRDILRALKQGKGVAVLHDVWGGRDGRMAEFFGHTVSTLAGVIEIAIRYNVPIIISFARRKINGNHSIHIAKPLIPGQLESLSSADAILKHYHNLLEDAIRERPFLWLWTHRRFKGVIDYR